MDKLMERKILVGRQIKALRKRRGLSQEDLADRAAISAKYLSRVEVGRQSPTLDVLLRLANGLDVEPYELLWFEEDELVCKLRTRAAQLIDDIPDKDIARVVGFLEAVRH